MVFNYVFQYIHIDPVVIVLHILRVLLGVKKIIYIAAFVHLALETRHMAKLPLYLNTQSKSSWIYIYIYIYTLQNIYNLT